MRLMFFNRSLGCGGAERQLVTTACAMQLQGVPVAVMVLYGGPFRAELDAAGVTVFELGKKGRWDFFVLRRLVRAANSWRPDAIYCYSGAMLFATMVKPFLKCPALVWGIRASKMDFQFYDRVSHVLIRLHPFLARRADLVICNSKTGREHVIDKGFPPERTVVVPNGIDTDRWRFSKEGRGRMRDAWGVSRDQRLIGIVARLDPIKDHATFLKLAAKCYRSQSNTRFVLIGDDSDSVYSARLRSLAKDSLPEGAVIWAGPCADLASAYSALDLLVMTSLAEGFPNAVGEGMSCGLRVVATDAGDTRSIVGEMGYVTPIGDVNALASAVLEVISNPACPPHAEIRNRIVSNYGLHILLQRTLDLIGETASELSKRR